MDEGHGRVFRWVRAPVVVAPNTLHAESLRERKLRAIRRSVNVRPRM